MTKRLDLVGKRFFRWTVLKFVRHQSRTYWQCRCDCGAEKIVYGPSLTKGLSQSCGCWNAEVAKASMYKVSQGNIGRTNSRRTHGEATTRTAEYRTWVSMHERCRSPVSQKWINYGGRGIRVCEHWSSFENFLNDMGRRPSKTHSLDRINNDGNYEPSNCRWATKKEQVDNRRKFGRVEKFDDLELLREVSRRGLPLNTSVDGYLSFST